MKSIKLKYKTAYYLGFSGAIPFILSALSVWIIGDKFLNYLIHGIIIYSFLIFTFIGAIYWGLGLLNNINKISKKFFICSILPSLCSWVVLLVEILPIIKISLAFILFNMLVIIERYVFLNHIKLKWFYDLRLKLNILVTMSLLIIIIKLLNAN